MDLTEYLRMFSLYGSPGMADTINRYPGTIPNNGMTPPIVAPGLRDNSQQPVTSSNPADASLNLPQPRTYQPPDVSAISNYTPSTTISDMYLKSLQQEPQPNQFPSTGRRIASGLALLSRDTGEGMKLSEYTRDPQYYRDMVDWKAKSDELAKGAQVENVSNVNNRIAASAEAAANVSGYKAEANAQNQADKLQVAEARAATLDYKAHHPNAVFQEDADGYIIALDPITHKAEYVTDPDGKKVKSSKMPELQKINLGIAGRMKEIAAQGANQLANTEKANEGKIANTQEANKGKVAVQGMRTGPGGKPMTPAQIQQDRINKANQLAIEQPELARWIHIDKTSTNQPLSITPVDDSGQNGPTQDQYNTIVDFMLNKGDVNLPAPAQPNNSASPVHAAPVQVNPPVTATPAPAGTNTPAPTPPPSVAEVMKRPEVQKALTLVPQGRVLVVNDQGKVLTIPNTAQQREALKKTHPNYVIVDKP